MPAFFTPRNRVLYGLLTITVLLLGFASRRWLGDYSFVKLYVGDALWALMVFLGLAVCFPDWSTVALATAALAFSFGIEFSQLYHVPWIDRIRAMPLGGLILGFRFVWSDLICYSVGVGAGVLLDCYFHRTPTSITDHFSRAHQDQNP